MRRRQLEAPPLVRRRVQVPALLEHEQSLAEGGVLLPERLEGRHTRLQRLERGHMRLKRLQGCNLRLQVVIYRGQLLVLRGQWRDGILAGNVHTRRLVINELVDEATPRTAGLRGTTGARALRAALVVLNKLAARGCYPAVLALHRQPSDALLHRMDISRSVLLRA